ncbi:MAG: DUF1858 domain-containing protein [Defluviitaleaceae bacterium]|nr:DUF1858 domain-containing protein [Defluviitaleaceae bacterium]
MASKDMIIADVLALDTTNSGEIAAILQRNGMGCGGCPSSRMKTLEMGAKAHGANVDEMVEEINNYLQSLKVN